MIATRSSGYSAIRSTSLSGSCGAAAALAPAPCVDPVAVVGAVAGAAGGGFDGSKPVCWVAHLSHEATSDFCLSADWPLAGYTYCCATATDVIATNAIANGHGARLT